MKKVLKAALSFLLICCLIFQMVVPVAAEEIDDAFESNNAWVEDFGTGKMFIQQTDEKDIVVGIDPEDIFVTVSIKYTATPDVVYEWSFYDYPETEFRTDSYSFWTDIIEYAEERKSEATEIEFTYEEVDPNEPMVVSSAGVDLRLDLEKLEGKEHTDSLIKTKVMDGKAYKLYETMHFTVRKDEKVISWKNAMKVGSMVAEYIGEKSKNTRAKMICAVLGVVFDGVETIIPAGKLNCYTCQAYYYQYIKVDSSSRYYADSSKIVTYKGYEDADDNSTGRATVDGNSKTTQYSHSETYFNSGIFDAAYEAYNS